MIRMSRLHQQQTEADEAAGRRLPPGYVHARYDGQGTFTVLATGQILQWRGRNPLPLCDVDSVYLIFTDGRGAYPAVI